MVWVRGMLDQYSRPGQRLSTQYTSTGPANPKGSIRLGCNGPGKFSISAWFWSQWAFDLSGLLVSVGCRSHLALVLSGLLISVGSWSQWAVVLIWLLVSVGCRSQWAFDAMSSNFFILSSAWCTGWKKERDATDCRVGFYPKLTHLLTCWHLRTMSSVLFAYYNASHHYII